jgi:hypothetical protein
VWRHLRMGSGDGWKSGLITLAMVGPMIATGYLIQAITSEGLLRAMAWSHIGMGLVYGVALLAHQFAAGGREARAARALSRRAKRRHRHRRRPAAQQGRPPAA